jgi:hypothetical protein
MFKQIVAVTVALTALALVSCGKAPEQEMENAALSMDAAKAAEAESYAPEAYRLAVDTLNAAIAAKEQADSKSALFRGYGKAKELYTRAQVLAQEAESSALAEKERMAQEVADLIAQTKLALDEATAALANAPRGKGSKAEIELMKNDLAAASATYEQATVEFDAGKYVSAKTKLEAVMSKAAGVSAEIAKAVAKKTGR